MRTSTLLAAVVMAVGVACVLANSAPTAVSLSSNTFEEGSTQGTEVGMLTTTDPDAADTFTYTITSQAPSNAVAISGDKLVVGSAGVNLDAGATVSVTIRSSDPSSATVSDTFTITVVEEDNSERMAWLAIVAGFLFVVAGFTAACLYRQSSFAKVKKELQMQSRSSAAV